MVEILTLSQSSLLLPSVHSPPTRAHFVTTRRAPVSLAVASKPSTIFAPSAYEKLNLLTTTRTRVISDSRAPTTFTFDSSAGGCDILPDSGGSGDSFGSSNGGGDDGDGNGGDSNEGGAFGEGDGGRKPGGLSMSQKLTLGYAGLIVVGGAVGYVKAGSLKSLASGVVSAFVLGWVYKLLPRFPLQASVLGCVVSTALVVVMGGRYRRSGKVFPAGVVALTSLVMSGGYLHGIMRSLH